MNIRRSVSIIALHWCDRYHGEIHECQTEEEAARHRSADCTVDR